MNKSRALGLAVPSMFVITCGVVIAILIAVLKSTLEEGIATTGPKEILSLVFEKPYWLFGLVYIIPGFLCFVAALVQNKCYYIVNCIITIICVLIMGLIIFLTGFPIILLFVGSSSYSDQCREGTSTPSYFDSRPLQSTCECPDKDLDYKSSGFKDCSYMKKTINLIIGLAIVNLLAWLGLLVSFVMATVYACRSKRTSGTVYTPAQQPMITH